MYESGKILVWTKSDDLVENLNSKIDPFSFAQVTYTAELLALAPIKNTILILVYIDASNILEGIKILQDIRQLSQDVPIVVFSEQLSPAVILEILPLNIYDYIVTPIKPHDILQILNDIMKRNKGRESNMLLFNLSEKLHQLTVENEIIKLLNSTTDLDRILDIIIKKSMDLIPVEASSILLFNETRDKLIFKAVYGEKADIIRGKSIDVGQGIAGWVAKEGKSALVNDVANDKRFFDGIDKISAFKTISILCIPIQAETKIHGVIELINKKDELFTPDDVEKISALSSFAALALNKSNLIKTERKRVEEITLLFEIGTYLTGMLNLEELLQRSAHLIRRSFGFYYLGISLVDHEECVLELKSFDCEESGISPKRKKVTFDQGLMGWVVRHGVPLIIDDVLKDERYLKGIESIRSEMVIPIKRKDTIFGVIDIGGKDRNAFNNDDKILTEQIARLLSISIENATLYKKVGRLAIIDDLTGLYNARYCHILLERINREKMRFFTIIFLDLDFFKLVNDQFGHQVGGKLLREVGIVINSVIRKSGITTRYGGDEYVIILPECDTEGAKRVAEKILQNMNGAVFLQDEGIDYHITASFGIASSPEHSENSEHVLRLADRAMYWVKNHGRNDIKIYDRDVTEVSDYSQMEDRERKTDSPHPAQGKESEK
jgi:diguanylate cyclase (GGDEF)-like protein